MRVPKNPQDESHPPARLKTLPKTPKFADGESFWRCQVRDFPPSMIGYHELAIHGRTADGLADKRDLL